VSVKKRRKTKEVGMLSRDTLRGPHSFVEGTQPEMAIASPIHITCVGEN
jgi:hypothetical protein